MIATLAPTATRTRRAMEVSLVPPGASVMRIRPRLLTIAEAAEELGRAPQSLERWVTEGLVPVVVLPSTGIAPMRGPGRPRLKPDLRALRIAEPWIKRLFEMTSHPEEIRTGRGEIGGPGEPEYLGVREAAGAIGMTHTIAYQLIRLGDFPAVSMDPDGVALIARGALDDWVFALITGAENAWYAARTGASQAVVNG